MQRPLFTPLTAAGGHGRCEPSRLSEQDPGGHPGGAGQGEEAAAAESRSQHPAVLQSQPEGGAGQRGAAAHRRPAEGRPAARTRTLLRLLHHTGLLVWKPHPAGAPPPGARPLTRQPPAKYTDPVTPRPSGQDPTCTSPFVF